MICSATIFVLSVGCVYLCGSIAERRNRSPKLWRPLGAIFGPIALTWIALLPSNKEAAS
jgi:hypothetical protein